MQVNIFSEKMKRQNFTFSFPLKHKVVRDLKIITETAGNLEVECVGYINPAASRIDVYERYSVDIDFIRWNGTDIKPVLEITGGMEEIIEAAIYELATKDERRVA